MRGILGIVVFIMLALGNVKRRFVNWLLRDHVDRSRLLPPPKEHITNAPLETRQEYVSRLHRGTSLPRQQSVTMGVNSIHGGSVVGGVTDGFEWDTSDSVLNGLGQFGMEISAGEPQWYGGAPAAQRSIFDLGVGAATGITSGKIVNMVDPALPQDGATKNYVDSVAGGAAWRNPVCVTEYIGNLTLAQVNVLVGTPGLGAAFVADNTDGAGWPAIPTFGTNSIDEGDLVEWSGTDWDVIVPHNGSNVPPGPADLGLQWGTRVLVSTMFPLIDSSSSDLIDGVDDGKILEWGGITLVPVKILSLAGYAVLVNCKNTGGSESIFENEAYSFQGAVPTGTWILFQGAVPPHVDLAGLDNGSGFDGDAGHHQVVLLGGRSLAESGSNGQIVDGGTLTGGILHLRANPVDGNTNGNVTVTGSALQPSVDDAVNIGTGSQRWKNLNAYTGFFSTAVRVDGNLGVVRPFTSGQGLVGAIGSQWREGWIQTLNVPTMLQGSSGAGQHLTIQGNFTGDGNVQINNGSDLVMLGTDSILPTPATGGTIGDATHRFASSHINSGSFYTECNPGASGVGNLGTDALRWADMRTVLSNYYGDMIMRTDSDFTPLTDEEGEIGTTAAAWKNLETYSAGFKGNMLMRGDHVFEPEFDLEGQIGRASIAGLFATGSLSGINNPNDGDTFTIGAQTYRFKDVMVQINDVQRLTPGPTGFDNLFASFTSLLLAINLTGIFGTDYFAGTAINADVTGSPLVGAPGPGPVTLNVTAKVAGIAANAVSLAVSNNAPGFCFWSAATLLGGVDAVVAVRFKSVTAQVINMGDAVMERIVDDPGYNGEHVKVRLKEFPEGIMAINEMTGEEKWMLKWDAP